MKTLDSTHFLLAVELENGRLPPANGYPFSLPAVSALQTLELHPSVTFIVGENGTGKSTLLEAIAVAWGFNPEGGSQNFSFSSRASHSELHEFIELRRGLRRPRDGYFLRAESLFNVATNIEQLDREADEAGGWGKPIIDFFGGRSLHELSHGESFFRLFTHRFGGNGFYILDEPEAALSPSRQMALISRLHDLVQQGSQFLIATHSPIIMAYPNSTIYLLTANGYEVVNYTDTEHYAVAREFLNNHEKMLKMLLEN